MAFEFRRQRSAWHLKVRMLKVNKTQFCFVLFRGSPQCQSTNPNPYFTTNMVAFQHMCGKTHTHYHIKCSYKIMYIGKF